MSDASGTSRGFTALSSTTVIRDLAARNLTPRSRSRKLAAEALAIEAEEAQQAGIPKPNRVLTSLILGYPKYKYQKSIRRELAGVRVIS